MKKVIVTVLIGLFIYTPLKARKKNTAKNKATSYEAGLPQPDSLAAQSMPEHALYPPAELKTSKLGRIGVMSDARTGIDVSHHQGKIRWTEVAEDEQVGFVYLKASEGESLVDKHFHENLLEAREAGLKVGCYHFFSPTVAPEKQFENFSAVFKQKEHDLLPIVDVELRGKNTAEGIRNRLNRFLRLFEEHYGYKPMIYTGQNFYNRNLSHHYSDYKFMIACYKDDAPVLEDGKEYILWQFTASSRVQGIRGNVDQSIFHDNADLRDIMMP